MEDSKKLWLSIKNEIPKNEFSLGWMETDSYINSPDHLCFVMARYKFCSRMLDGKENVLEIGCCNGFGSVLVAKHVKNLICTDIDEKTIEQNTKKYNFLKNTTFKYWDFREKPYTELLDAIYLVDVLEHIYQAEEEVFLPNIVASLTENGVLLIGTPNKKADCFSSEYSKKYHVNTKTYKDLRELGNRYFKNVFSFSMNDEVVHTGYPEMAHYLWILAVDPQRKK